MERETNRAYDAAVLGCGLMGSALATQLAAAGVSTAAWNRSHSKAEALAPAGVTPVEHLDDVVRRSRVVVVCMTSYVAVRGALSSASSWDGEVVVNLTSGTPQEARDLAKWAARRGVSYLDGNVACYPREIGSSRGMLLVSGPTTTWERHREVVGALGPAVTYVGDRIEAANVLAVGILGTFFVSALDAFIEGAAYVFDHGVTAEAMRPATAQMLALLQHATVEAAGAIEADDHASDQASLEIFAEGARAALAGLRAAGHHGRVIAAAVENLDEAECAGWGTSGISAQSKVLGPRA